MFFKKGEPLGKELWSSGQVCVLARSLERIKPVISLRLLSFWLLCRRPLPGAQGLPGRAVTAGVGAGPRGALTPSSPHYTQPDCAEEAPLPRSPSPYSLDFPSFY